MAVAAVANGVAHMGLGIYSAAKALGLDFIPLAKALRSGCGTGVFQSELMEDSLRPPVPGFPGDGVGARGL